jgi:Sulfotransferase family
MTKRPVFIVGSPRSGTTLLYHMLLSSGGFAVYLTESKVFDLLFPKFGNLHGRKNLAKALDLWLRSKLFTVSGLDRTRIADRILAECRNGGDFLRIVMEEIATTQKAERWADNTPEHVLYLPTILKEIPQIQVIHMIRDGRDVALSLDKKGWIHPFPWDAKRRGLVAGLYWEWMVEKGRAFGRANGSDYLEVRYEDLTTRPEEALAKIGAFIGHDLNYERIRQVAIGSVSEPNTSFESEIESMNFHPVGRWRSAFSPEELKALEALVGGTLEQLGYSLSASRNGSNHVRTSWNAMRKAYRSYWDSKLWLKTRTPLARIFATASAEDL